LIETLGQGLAGRTPLALGGRTFSTGHTRSITEPKPACNDIRESRISSQGTGRFFCEMRAGLKSALAPKP
jgi:hypothetical protein